METEMEMRHLKHTTISDTSREILTKVFKSTPTLKSFIHWNPLWSKKKDKWLKVPAQKVNKPESHMLLQEALSSEERPIGLVFSNNHDYIALDIDGVDPNTTPSLKKFLTDHPTYEEYSPSGRPNRTRLLYRLPHPEDKNRLKAKTKTIPRDQQQDPKAEIELFSSSNNYATLTGQETPTSASSIAFIEITELLEHFPTFKAGAQIIPINEASAKQIEESQNKTASLVHAKTWVDVVPAHRDDSKLNQVINRLGLTYYEFWLQGVMSLHAAWGTFDGFPIAKAWSEKSGEDYDFDELEEKWKTFNDQKDDKITKATYQWMFNLFSVDWPVISKSSQVPSPIEIDNFKAFLAHQGLSIDRDAVSGTYFLSGQVDSDIYPTYYENKKQAYSIRGGDIPRLASRLQAEASKFNFRPQHRYMENFIVNTVSDKFTSGYVNRFALEIASKPIYNPQVEPDYFQLMARSIIQKAPSSKHPTQEFHDLLVRKWLLSLGRTFWPDELANPNHASTAMEGILILSDKSRAGGTNKSSLGARLFPPEWYHLYTQTDPGQASGSRLREYYLETVKSCLIDWDEVDSVIKPAVSNAKLKSLITAKEDVARTPYDREPTYYPRRYSLMASTNKSDLTLPEEGLRRFWWLNISYIDTYKLDTWDIYNLWRQIRYELQHYDTTISSAPWVLTTEEKKYLISYLSAHKSTSSLEEYLLDMFDWSKQGFIDQQEMIMSRVDNGQLTLSSNNTLVKMATYGLKEIADICEIRKTSLKQLKHIITSLLKEHAPDELYFKRTLIEKGTYKFRGQKRYFLPIKRNDALMRESATLD